MMVKSKIPSIINQMRLKVLKQLINPEAEQVKLYPVSQIHNEWTNEWMNGGTNEWLVWQTITD